MKFAIPFSRKFRYPTSPDIIQWNIKYKPKIKELNNFIQAYTGYRINFIFDQDFDLERDTKIIKALQDKFIDTNKIVIRLETYQKEIDEVLTNQNILHYYNEYIFDIDRFNGFLNLQVSDIYVTDSLMFNIQALSNRAKEKNIALRTFCNVCQSSWRDTPSLKTFFIRPEDMSLYEDFIDTFEFMLPYTDQKNHIYDISKLNVLYQVYTIDKKWFGPLKEIIIGYNGEEKSQYLIKDFAKKRIACQKKCFLDPNSCAFCERIANLGQLLEKTKLYIKY